MKGWGSGTKRAQKMSRAGELLSTIPAGIDHTSSSESPELSLLGVQMALQHLADPGQRSQEVERFLL